MNPFQFILDLLYPARCLSCAAMGDWWCSVCRNAVERLPSNPCPKCLEATSNHDVTACSGTLPFAGVVATGFYHSPPLRRFIAGLKYEGVTAAAPSVEAYLREILSSRTTALPWAQEPSLLIQPMPLADTRERERGFNQARFIAERMRTAWNINGSISDVLIRRAGTVAQAELAHDAALRSANVQGQFQAIGQISHPVLLVDDVVTTGSTAAEAARVLIKAGAPRVYLAALAVGK